MDKQNIEDQKRDHALYYVEDVDPNFNPERNKQVIKNSIKKYEAMRARKQKDYIESIRERSDAVVSYLKSKGGEGNVSVEQYFGKKELARLQGVNILNKLKRTVMNQQKNIYIPQ